MKGRIGLLALVLLGVAACGVFGPSERCWWQYRGNAMRADTVWNTIPDTGDPTWIPFIIVERPYWTDSTRVCR